MLKTEYVAAFIEEQLNLLGDKASPKSFNFKIFAEVGEDSSIGKIKGILQRVTGDISKIKDFIDIDYLYSCTLSVPCVKTNYNLLKINEIVDGLIENLNGKEIELCNGKVLFNFKINKQDAKKEEYNNIPLSFNIGVKFVENAVTSYEKHWLLDGIEIPYKTEGVYIDKEGALKKLNGEEFSKVLITGQTKSYKFTFPYDASNELCVKLQKDILGGDIEKSYELKYFDGVAFTEDNPFATSVSIYKQGGSSAEVAKTSDFDLMFTDVDNGCGEVKYYLGLCDTVFDNVSDNTRFFKPDNNNSAEQKQKIYWEQKIVQGCSFEQIKAPNLDSLDITNQIYRNTKNYNLFDVVNKNYAVIKVERVGYATDYYYYFVTNARCGAKNQVLLDLKLDSIQTYFFKENIIFGDCLINKAHLDRWIHGSGNKVQFEYRADVSKLFEREDITNVAKRLVKRTKVSLNNFFADDEVNRWFDDNVLCWVYAFVSPTDKFTFEKNQIDNKGKEAQFSEFSGTKIIPFECNDEIMVYDSHYIDSQLQAIAIPIFKENAGIKVEGHDVENPLHKIKINWYGFLFFMKNNNDASKIYSLKISALPPLDSEFFKKEQLFEYEIGTNNVLRFKDKTQVDSSSNVFVPLANGRVFCTTHSNFDNAYGFFSVDYQRPYLKSKRIKLLSEISFNKSELIGQKKNPKFNPKLLSSDYKSLKVCDYTGDGFEYDIQKLGLDEIELMYTEPLTADLNKSYIRISNTYSDSVYVKDTSQNFTGFCGSNDMSMVLRTSAFQAMLANNKNYYNQTWLNVGMNGILTGINGTANAKSTPGLGLSLAGSFASAGMELLNSAMTEDNMRNAPSSIQNVKGSAFLNLMSSPLGVYLEEYDILENEKYIINDYMDLYGFTYNRVDNVKNVCNIRKYHNYVRAELNSISGVPMSNNIRADIKQRFQTGVRFWNSDDIQYELENYENWLE